MKLKALIASLAVVMALGFTSTVEARSCSHFSLNLAGLFMPAPRTETVVVQSYYPYAPYVAAPVYVAPCPVPVQQVYIAPQPVYIAPQPCYQEVRVYQARRPAFYNGMSFSWGSWR